MKHSRFSTRRAAESLELRLCPTAFGFVNHEINRVEHPNPVAQLSDIDTDGDLDIVATDAHGISWYPNENGAFTGRPQRLADIEFRVDRLKTVDLDGDGDLDLVFAWPLQWYENIDGQGTFVERQDIGSFQHPLDDFLLVDWDSDNHLDVLISHRFASEVLWYRNVNGTGNFSEPEVLYSSNVPFDQIQAADMDGDGRLDLVVSPAAPNTIGWLKSRVDGKLGALTEIGFAENPIHLELLDIDGDHDLDVLARISIGAFQGFFWYENFSHGSFGEPQFVTTSFGSESNYSVGDLDNDGDVDLAVIGRRGEIEWFRNTDGDFSSPISVRFPNSLPSVGFSLDIGDLDGDGRQDLLWSVSFDNRIGWFRGDDRLLSGFGEETVITRSQPLSNIQVADMDGDGDMDIIASKRTQIIWLENTEESARFSTQHQVADPVLVRKLRTGDLDGDGDQDVVAEFGGNAGGNLIWYENLDRQGSFSDGRIIRNENVNGRSLADIDLGDLDQDGDIDIVVGIRAQGLHHTQIVWFENTDGAGTFEENHLIRSNVGDNIFVMIADVDGDGDNDILSNPTRRSRDGIVWYENRNGQFNTQHEIVTGLDSPLTGRPSFADLDGDGDLDLVALMYQEKKLVWYENLDGEGQFGGQLNLVTHEQGISLMTMHDMDLDGDLDLLSRSSFSCSNCPITERRLSWLENTEEGIFGEQHTITSFPQNASLLNVTDFDGDADIDFLSRENRTWSWLENRPVGDATGDGLFDSSDLVAVFMAGEYEDNNDGNSGFEEGDWNGDGDFDSSDLVFALQSGAYSHHASRRSMEPVTVEHIFRDEMWQQRAIKTKRIAVSPEPSTIESPCIRTLIRYA